MSNKSTLPIFREEKTPKFSELKTADRFDLAPYAFHLGQILEAVKDRSGFVLLINAPWGAGKTSVVNWTETLMTGFDPAEKKDSPLKGKSFEELASEEDEILDPFRSPRSDTEAIRRQVAEWNKLTDAKKWVFAHFDSWSADSEAELIFALLDVLDDELSEDETQKYMGRAKRIILRNPGAMLNKGVELAGAAFPGLKNLIDFQDMTLLSPIRQKLQIEEKIGDRRVVLLVDDIDRLPPEKMMAVFQAIWFLRGMKNVIFITVFDQKLVERALGQILNDGNDDSGAAFLQKIVQFSMDLPKPSVSKLLKELEAYLRLEDVASHANAENTRITPSTSLADGEYGIGMPRWTAIRNFILADCLDSPRAVRRLADEVQLEWYLYSGAAADIDVRDMIALQALRVFQRKKFDRVVEIINEIERNNPVPKIDENEDYLKVLLPNFFEDDAGGAIESEKDVKARNGFGYAGNFNKFLRNQDADSVADNYNFHAIQSETPGAFAKDLLRAEDRKHIDRFFLILRRELIPNEPDKANKFLRFLKKELDSASGLSDALKREALEHLDALRK